MSEVPVGRETLLVALLIVVAALFVCTIAFSTYAIVLRLQHRRRDRIRTEFHERWSDPLLTTLGDSSAVPSLLGSVAPSERTHFVGFIMQYARRLRGEGVQAVSDLARPLLGLIASRADSPSEEIRARAIQTLGTLGLADHGPRVVAALGDPSPLVAMVAARALSQKGSPEHAAAVLGHLERFRGWNRRFLASMLASMGPDVAGTLRDGLADESKDTFVRAVLAEALQIQGDPAAGDVAAHVLERSSDRDLRSSALRLLRDVGRIEHAPGVRRLCDSSDEVVRAQALRTLGSVGGAQDVPRLLEEMRNPSPWVALNAARGAREAGGEGTLRALAASSESRAMLARQVLTEVGSR